MGESFSGVISSVTGFGLFVRLDDLFIDGLVHISTLDNDYYRFDVEKQRLIGENSGMIYRLGDKVRIKVEAVHLQQKMVDFSLLESERKPRRAGKTAKQKAKRSFQELPQRAQSKGNTTASAARTKKASKKVATRSSTGKKTADKRKSGTPKRSSKRSNRKA